MFSNHISLLCHTPWRDARRSEAFLRVHPGALNIFINHAALFRWGIAIDENGQCHRCLEALSWECNSSRILCLDHELAGQGLVDASAMCVLDTLWQSSFFGQFRNLDACNLPRHKQIDGVVRGMFCRYNPKCGLHWLDSQVGFLHDRAPAVHVEDRIDKIFGGVMM